MVVFFTRYRVRSHLSVQINADGYTKQGQDQGDYVPHTDVRLPSSLAVRVHRRNRPWPRPPAAPTVTASASSFLASKEDTKANCIFLKPNTYVVVPTPFTAGEHFWFGLPDKRTNPQSKLFEDSTNVLCNLADESGN